MKKNLILITALAFIAAACAGSPGEAGGGQYDEFAQCMTDSGAVMYGAYWCPNCAQQKDMFGNSFDHITYIECSLPNRGGVTRACQLAGIEAYPTWEFSDGSRVTGTTQLSRLAEITGCELNPEE